VVAALDKATQIKPEDRFETPMALATAMFPQPPTHSSKIF
jgi:hypothetical protein